jgi:copper chaperone CopZ
MSTTTLKVTGMTCGHCVASVKKALEHVPGVESAEVNLGEGRAVVAGEAEASALIDAVQKEGYQAALQR